MAPAPERSDDRHGSVAQAEVIDLQLARAQRAARARRFASGAATTHRTGLAEAQRMTTLQNIAAIVVLVALAAAGAYFISELRKSTAIQACIDSGRRDCARIDLGR